MMSTCQNIIMQYTLSSYFDYNFDYNYVCSYFENDETIPVHGALVDTTLGGENATHGTHLLRRWRCTLREPLVSTRRLQRSTIVMK